MMESVIKDSARRLAVMVSDNNDDAESSRDDGGS